MSSNSLLHSFVDSPFTRTMIKRRGTKHPMVHRFVAGDQLNDALLVVKELRAVGIQSTIDYLGEEFLLADEIEAAVLQYLEIIKALATFYPEETISVKLSAIGLTKSKELARENLRRILESAHERGDITIRVDMEGSDYTEATLDLVREMHQTYPGLGTVIQSYLRRSDRDIEILNEEKISIRLVKGAYDEPSDVAFSQKTEVDRQFKRQMFLLLGNGSNPAIATHDPQMIKDAKLFAKRDGITANRFEFEMLLGVRRDLQEQLAKEGYKVRVYIPYGDQWYAYFTRRLSERPANLGFLLKNILRG